MTIPEDIRQLLQTAEAKLRAGNFQASREIYTQALRKDPNSALVTHALGWIALRLNEVQAAVDLLSRAARLAPGVPAIHMDLATAHEREGDAASAVLHLRKAIALEPASPTAHRALGQLLLGLGQTPEALAALRHWARIENSAAAHYELGTALARSGDPQSAIDHLRRAVALEPNHGSAHCNLGLAFEDVGQNAQAADALRQAIRLMRDPSVARYHLAALGAGEPPATCPPRYLVELFDNYADRFEHHLVTTLGYQGPQLLLDIVKSANPQPPLDVMDLGCGTGLCGVLFRPLVRTLVGVDLAPRMIAISKSRNVYDTLLQSDLPPALDSRPEAFDLLLAADVFIYIGDLSPVFRSAATALRPGGLFAFTIERTDSADFLLLPTRRYAQSVAYIRRLSAQFGFEELASEDAVLRAGETGDVPGTVFLLRRQAP
jgi:predicted TPR repeat methyltransferase